MPLPICGDRAIQREHGEKSSRGFMEKLASGAPDYAQRNFQGLPERRIEAVRHAMILVHNERNLPEPREPLRRKYWTYDQ